MLKVTFKFIEQSYTFILFFCNRFCFQNIANNCLRFVGSFVGNQAQTMPQATSFWQPNNFNPFQTSQSMIPTSFGQQQQQQTQTFSSQPKIRYHPGKGGIDAPPALTQADLSAGMNVINQMPHQVCASPVFHQELIKLGFRFVPLTSSIHFGFLKNNI